MKTLIFLICLVISQAVSALDLYSERAMGLFHEIQCPTCRSQTIDASSSSDAEVLRSEVLKMIEDGKTNEEIRKTIADKYGAHIVKDYSKPVMKTWAYSIIVFILIVYFISRARRRKRK